MALDDNARRQPPPAADPTGELSTYLTLLGEAHMLGKTHIGSLRATDGNMRARLMQMTDEVSPPHFNFYHFYIAHDQFRAHHQIQTHPPFAQPQARSPHLHCISRNLCGIAILRPPGGLFLAVEPRSSYSRMAVLSTQAGHISRVYYALCNVWETEYYNIFYLCLH
jgi:hypothetical protein